MDLAGLEAYKYPNRTFEQTRVHKLLGTLSPSLLSSDFVQVQVFL